MAKSFKRNAAEMFISTSEEPAPKTTPKKKAPKEAPAIPRGYVIAKAPRSSRMQLLVRPELKEELAKQAQAQGVSVNDLCNTIFDNYLESIERG